MTILQLVKDFCELCKLFVKNVVFDYVSAMNDEFSHSHHTQFCNGYAVPVFVKVKTVAYKPPLKLKNRLA